MVDMKYDGFTVNDIFCNKNSLHNQVQQARNTLMLEKGLNPSSIQDQEKVTINGHVAFIKVLCKSSHEMKLQFTALFKKLSVTGYDTFKFLLVLLLGIQTLQHPCIILAMHMLLLQWNTALDIRKSGNCCVDRRFRNSSNITYYTKS
eukprot:14913590-Ditylum_brightwellii.AAC.1